MKTNISFFTHEVGALDHRKFLILRAFYGGELGWAMEAKFWGLNCLIGDAKECRLDTNAKGEKARIARALELSLKDLDAFLVVLKDEAELIHDDEGVIWTDQTQEDLRRAMTARQDAKNRRNGNVGLPSADESKTSADESKTSADENHGGEGIGGDRIREEQQEDAHARGPAAAAPSDFVDPEDADRYAFALRRVLSRKKKPDRPEAMALRIMNEPDVIAAWKLERMPKGEPLAQPGALNAERAPAPPACTCGGEIKAVLTVGEGMCLSCGRPWTFDRDWNEWYPDPPVESSA